MEETRDGFAVIGGPLAVIPFDKVTKPPTMRGHLLGTLGEIDARTFHALGYDVIGDQNPPLPHMH